MSSSDSRRSKDSAGTTDVAAAAAVNVTHIFDTANDNFIRLINESAKVQAQYAQAVSNLQQECIDVVRIAVQRTTSIQKQLASSNSNFNNVIISDAAAPYVQDVVRQSSDFTNNLIRMADINNQLTINALHALRENVKNSSRTVEAIAEYNSNLATAWASSSSSFQQQFTPSRH
ncbi:MAG TPA: hypothetical protein VE130_02910 [Nitrososphaeraceae archaeon]|jgi:hypothetical protein|nr:hypothetical protein [Nitrososphaeraceae archaeon]